MGNNLTPKKTKWRLNIFDVIIIAVVLTIAAAVLIIWRSTGIDKSTGDDASATTIRYTVELTNMAGDTANLISAGDTLIDSVKKNTMGTVVLVDVSVMTTSTKNLENGDTVLSPVPDKMTATIVLEVEGTETQSQIVASSGYLIRVGEIVQALGPGYAGLGYIIAVERVGDEG